jgi:ABC-type lipoprotein export system ATPase subunit
VNPRVAAFLSGLGLPDLPIGSSIDARVSGLSETALHDMGLDREQLAAQLHLLMDAATAEPTTPREAIHTLTISGGSGKDGRSEAETLAIRAGEIVCIVGPTGSGKSRLLADVECLAQGDTPSGRHILLNNALPTSDQRFAPDCKLVAQLSQNMNFVVDLTVGAFLDMHAACRQIDPRSGVTGRIIAIANSLAGERFSPDVSLTQLSGGQARALMIADAALLSESPIVLIDEIENAGINRRHALDLLVAEDKIVLISTHDPLLALLGDRRVIIKNGRIADVIATSEAEKSVLVQLESIDAAMLALRERLRRGDRIEDPIDWGPTVEERHDINARTD